MNPNDPSPSDSNPTGRRAQIEQKLKRLQPRPVSFNAETIICAAQETEPQATLSDRTVRKRGGRSARWLTISTAFVGGAIAGTLLTCLVLIRGHADDTAKTTDVKKMFPSNVAVGKYDIPNDIVDDMPQEGDPPDSQWSRSDWLVSAQLHAIRGPWLTGGPPLMAGNYVLRSTSNVPGVENSPLSKPDSTADTPQSNGHAPDKVRPTRSIDRKQMLDELFDGRFSSRL